VGKILVPFSPTNQELCTIILIRADVGLTAKHCFTEHGYDSAYGNITMRFDSIYAATGGQVRIAEEVKLASGIDLAVVHFKSTTGISLIPLVQRNQGALWKNGTVSLASGWGGNPSILQVGSMKIKDQVYSSAQRLTGYNYLMKAESYYGNVSSGDSGGPLINERFVDGRVVHTLVGVLSQKSRLGAAAYTKVASTLPWITSTLNGMLVLAPPG
jgi:V8-like Glu-specific endopeptidase